MTTLNAANAVRMGTAVVSRVYAGPTQAWPVVVPGYPGVILGTAQLVGYWRLSETSGTAAADASPGAHPGVYVASPTLGVAGAITGNTAITLNGTSQYVNFPSSAGSLIERIQDALEDAGAATPTPSGPVVEPFLTWAHVGDIVTIEAWVNRNGTTFAGLGGIVSKGVGGYYIRMDGTSGQFHFVRSKVANICSSTANVPSTGWHHVVGTKNGATVKLYLDGVDRTGTVTNQTLSNDVEPLVFGHDSGAAEWFKGSLDEVALYSRALTASEVLAHYNAGTALHVERVQARPGAGGTAATSGNFTHGAGFTATQDGTITHIATYHYATHASGVIHPLSLWTDAGVKVAHIDWNCPGTTLLADLILRPTPGADEPEPRDEVTPFVTGWYEVPLAVPYAITSGSTYRVSGSAATYTYFSTGPPASLAPHLTAVTTGFYSAGSDTFPTTAQPANYYPIDVVAEFRY